MIIKELSNLKVFPQFLKYLKNDEISAKEFINSDERAQIGYYLDFINSFGITFMITNFSIDFAFNKNNNNSKFNDTLWMPIKEHSIRFKKYTDSMEVFKIAIIKSFDLIQPF